MSQILLNQITPEQLEKQIIDGVKNQLNALIEHFQPKEPTEYLTRHEVANLLKVDISTVHNWTKNGKLTSYNMVGRVYYNRSEIEAAMIKSIPTE